MGLLQPRSEIFYSPAVAAPSPAIVASMHLCGLSVGMSSTGGATAAVTPGMAMALVSLDSYR